MVMGQTAKVAFRAGKFNIGTIGQFLIGTICTAIVGRISGAWSCVASQFSSANNGRGLWNGATTYSTDAKQDNVGSLALGNESIGQPC